MKYLRYRSQFIELAAIILTWSAYILSVKWSEEWKIGKEMLAQ